MGKARLNSYGNITPCCVKMSQTKVTTNFLF